MRASVLLVVLCVGMVCGIGLQELQQEVSQTAGQLAAARAELRAVAVDDTTDNIYVGEDDSNDEDEDDTSGEDMEEGQLAKDDESDDEDDESDDEDEDEDENEVPSVAIADVSGGIDVGELNSNDTDDDDDEDEDEDEDEDDDDVEEADNAQQAMPDVVIADDESEDDDADVDGDDLGSLIDDAEQLLEEDDLDAPLVPKGPEPVREPHHIPTALGNVECAKCQHARYLRCFRRQAENAEEKSMETFPTCDKDAQERCQLDCWDKLVAVDGIRDAVWKNEDFCGMCRDFQSGTCKRSWDAEAEGTDGTKECGDKAMTTCSGAGWCTGSEK